MIHIVTGEYPPMLGGVSDYAALVARDLVLAGEPVHVWTAGDRPAATGQAVTEKGVVVHRIAGRFSRSDLRTLDEALDSTVSPRRILVQWTPHSFGFRSLNLAFTAWVWTRARRHNDRVELMIHEPFLAFGEGSWRQNLAALVHRVMMVLLLNAAAKVWVSIPAWEPRLRAWCLGRPVPFQWLPIPSNIETAKTARTENPVPLRIGHFGTFRPDIARILEPTLHAILQGSDATVLLAGSGSEAFQARFATESPELAARVKATGALSSPDVARFLVSCELVVQPYPDGVSTRRGTAMAALSMGVPMVSNLGRLTEDLWSPSGAVELATAPDAESLATSALELMRDPARREILSRNAQALYASQFDVRHTTAALLAAGSHLAAAA